MAKKLAAVHAVPYGVHPGIAMMVKWVAELKDKTGRDLDGWLQLIQKEGPGDEKECREWLKAKHGFSYVPPTCTGLFLDVTCPSQFANWIEEFANEHLFGEVLGSDDGDVGVRRRAGGD